jgi:hypothetical protein
MLRTGAIANIFAVVGVIVRGRDEKLRKKVKKGIDGLSVSGYSTVFDVG